MEGHGLKPDIASRREIASSRSVMERSWGLSVTPAEWWSWHASNGQDHLRGVVKSGFGYDLVRFLDMAQRGPPATVATDNQSRPCARLSTLSQRLVTTW